MRVSMTAVSRTSVSASASALTGPRASSFRRPTAVVLVRAGSSSCRTTCRSAHREHRRDRRSTAASRRHTPSASPSVADPQLDVGSPQLVLAKQTEHDGTRVLRLLEVDQAFRDRLGPGSPCNTIPEKRVRTSDDTGGFCLQIASGVWGLRDICSWPFRGFQTPP